MGKSIINRLRNAEENNKIVYTNILGAFLVKGGALIVALLTMPAYIRFFNNSETLGLWFTMLSILNWILNFDLGIGNGLRNRLASAYAEGNADDMRRYISSSYFSVGIIIVLISVAFPVVIQNADLNTFFSIDETMISQATLHIAVLIVFYGVMIQFWLKLINSVLYALQMSFLNNLLMLCTNIVILLFVLYFPSGENETNLLTMALVHSLAVAAPLAIATIAVFAGKLKYAIPRFKYLTISHTKGILTLGGAFFFLQIGYMMIMGTNEYLITATAGNSFVVDYQAFYKIFSLGSTIFTLALTPLWSVITKAKAEGHLEWIQKTYKRFMTLAVLFCIGEFILVLVMEPIMHIWLGDQCIQSIDVATGLLFALLGSEMIINGVLSTVANGLGRLKIQAICFIVGACLKIPLSFLLVGWTGSWTGVVLANIICLGMYCVVQPFTIPKMIEN